LAVGLNPTIALLQLGRGQGKRTTGLGGMGPDHGDKNENKVLKYAGQPELGIPDSKHWGLE
jgi:hypothetical protein